jgi:hypothetical protein
MLDKAVFGTIDAIPNIATAAISISTDASAISSVLLAVPSQPQPVGINLAAIL